MLVYMYLVDHWVTTRMFFFLLLLLLLLMMIMMIMKCIFPSLKTVLHALLDIHFGLSMFWSVDVSVCRCFGLSTFWLSTFRVVDVLTSYPKGYLPDDQKRKLSLCSFDSFEKSLQETMVSDALNFTIHSNRVVSVATFSLALS